MSFKWFIPPTNADNRDFGFTERPPFDRSPFDRSEPSDAVDILTGTPERDVFELEPPGYDLDDNFIALGIPTIVDLPEDSQVDLLVYQEAESFDYIPGFTNPPERSCTIIEDFDPGEDEIIVGGKPYMIEIDDEIIAGESSNDVDHFRIMGNTTIDFEDFRGGGNHDFEDQILPIDFRLV